mgnify:CR=1 FL=1
MLNLFLSGCLSVVCVRLPCYHSIMENRTEILICDDEREIAELVAHLLEREGFAVCVCTSGAQALERVRHHVPDLVILDIMMPGMDGFEVCRRLRAQSQVPIIFLSAKDEEFDKVLGFTLGADDYVTKPFKPRELVVRVKARLRPRIQEAAAPDAGRLTPPILELAGIQLDGSGHRAFLHGEELALTPKEFDCLACLLRAAGAPVSARELFERVWGEEFCPSSNNTVMVHIRRLRRKLGEIDSTREFIETVWGVGYRIRGGGADV